MKLSCYSLLIIAFASCGKGVPHKNYTMDDIIFPGKKEGWESIKRNNICTSYYYYDLPDNKYVHELCDSAMTIIYDSNGNTIRNVDGHYEYNALHLLSYSFSGRCLASESYHEFLFDSEDKILYHLSHRGGQYSERPVVPDTMRSYFDESGTIFMSVFKPFKDTVRYFYYDNGKLSTVEDIFSKTQYFWTKDRLDSMYLGHKEDDSIFFDKYYYDEHGLPAKVTQYLDHAAYPPYRLRPIVSYKIRNVKCSN